MSSEQTDDPNQVLIVDDDMFNLQILNDLIRIQLQVIADQACSGQIAIDMVKENISKFKATRAENQLANVGGNQASPTIQP